MANRHEYEMLFSLNAQMGGSYNSTFKAAQRELVALQNEIMTLSKIQSDISAYQKQQASIEASQKKLELLQKQYDNIQREMSETSEYSSALENKLLSKQLQIEKTTGSISTQTAKLDQMGNALREAGIDTTKLTEDSARLGGQIDTLKEKQEAASQEADNFGTTASAAFGAVEQAIVAAGITVALKEIYEAYINCADASMNFESAMTGVAKTTDMSNEELAAMAGEIKDLSTDIPVFTDDFAGVGEVAGQLGIAKDNLMDFSTVMSMLSTATTMTAEAGATLLAQFANITRMNPDYYSNLASAIVDLGNNYATTEQKITEMAQGIAASASLAGMSEADMVALSAAVSSLGIETEMGSTAMSKLISDLMTAVETGDKLNEFASIANMTADEFTKAWGKNAVSALQAFVVGLSDTERNGKSATVVLTELGITESRMQRMILSLSNSGDLLNRTLDTANTAWTENTALINEAEKRYATTQSQLTMRQNAYNNLKIAIGDDLNPALRDLYAIETDILKDITAFVEKHPALIKAVTAFVAIMGASIAALTAYVAVMKIVIPLTALFAASIPGVNIIMGVVTGVAVLTAGIVALSSAISEEEQEIRSLTASSRKQYYELQQTNEEYEKAKEQYGETSDQALELRYKVDELTASYEANKQTIQEFVAENDALLETHDQIISSYNEATSSISDEEQGALALALKLKELSEKTSLTTVEQEQMKAIVDDLNESMPELALSYDDVAKSLNMSADSIKRAVKAQAEQEQQAENYRTWVDLTKEELELSAQLAEAQENLNLRRKELTEKNFNVDAPLIGWFTNLGDYEDEVERLQAAYEENQAALADMTAQAEEYAAAQESTTDGSRNLSDAISEITDEARKLTAAYQEAYDTALDSLTGQYNLWDQAADVVATSAGEINGALESQTKYWQDYNTNLSNLINRSGDIEGLAEMIATFADGSPDSVNAIAGMVNATDGQLASMVANWKELQEEQKNVAGSLADLETDFTASMNKLKTELETSIEKMNLNEEAAKSGRDTIQGFIDGANDKLPAVRTAYERIANAAIAAIDARLDIHSPSKVLELRGEHAMSGFVAGVASMEPEVTAAMSNAASAGTEAFTAEETRAASFAPQLMKYLGAFRTNNEAVSAESGGNGRVNYIDLTVSPSYSISGVKNPSDITTILREAAGDLKDYILEIIEDAGIDTSRRSYT
ncbi:MAG: phage tail tape measure protein [Syntrophobacter sp.]